MLRARAALFVLVMFTVFAGLPLEAVPEYRLFFASSPNSVDETFIELDPATGELLNVFPAPGSDLLGGWSLALVQGTLYALRTFGLDSGEPQMYAMDPDTGEILSSGPAPAIVENPLHLSPFVDDLAIVESDDRTIHRFDGTNLRHEVTIVLNGYSEDYVPKDFGFLEDPGVLFFCRGSAASRGCRSLSAGILRRDHRCILAAGLSADVSVWCVACSIAGGSDRDRSTHDHRRGLSKLQR